MHAAATTGPTRGPRPASSTPATSLNPLPHFSLSCAREGPLDRDRLAPPFAAVEAAMLVAVLADGARLRFFDAALAVVLRLAVAAKTLFVFALASLGDLRGICEFWF